MDKPTTRIVRKPLPAQPQIDLRKKTVKMPPVEMMEAARPLDHWIIKGQQAAQEDRNEIAESQIVLQKWNNDATQTIVDRLDEGETILSKLDGVVDVLISAATHIKTIKTTFLWLVGMAGAIIVGTLSILLADVAERGYHHFFH